MSMDKYVMVHCDKCGVDSTPFVEGVRETRKQAKASGWKLGKEKDFCPKCSNEIKEAIKAAASGL